MRVSRERYAHLYGLSRDDFAYILDQFPIAYTIRVETNGGQVFQHTHPSFEGAMPQAAGNGTAAGRWGGGLRISCGRCAGVIGRPPHMIHAYSIVFAGLVVAGAIVATGPGPALAQPQDSPLDVYFPDVTVAAGHPGVLQSPVLSASEPLVLSGVRVSFDLRELAGVATLPSARWNVSSTAIRTRGRARPEPFRVCTNSGFASGSGRKRAFIRRAWKSPQTEQDEISR